MGGMTSIAIWHRVLSQGVGVNHESYELNSHDAELFLQQHHQLRGAPLRRLKTEIKDSGPDPLLTVRPPVGAVSLPSTKHCKRRRCNDRLELTTLGRQLLNTNTARTKLGKDSVIWRLIEACAGDEQCDQPTGVASNCKCGKTRGARRWMSWSGCAGNRNARRRRGWRRGRRARQRMPTRRYGAG